jgi:hypothetical protein
MALAGCELADEATSSSACGGEVCAAPEPEGAQVMTPPETTASAAQPAIDAQQPARIETATFGMG